MADLNKTDIVSKTFSLELDTGQTRTVRKGQGPGRPVTTPITVKVPKLSTVSSYDVAEDGTVSNVNSKVRQVITKAEYDALPDNSRTTTLEQTVSFINEITGVPSPTTKYYAILATKKDGERTYTPNKEVLDAIPLAKGATSPSDRDKALFNKEVAEFNNKGKGQFLNVNRNAQDRKSVV